MRNEYRFNKSVYFMNHIYGLMSLYNYIPLENIKSLICEYLFKMRIIVWIPYA